MIRILGPLFGLAAAAALYTPSLGAWLLASCALVPPLVRPAPRTSLSFGPALVTAVILVSGWFGLGILQVTKRFASPGTEHFAIGCAVVGMTLSAARFGRDDDPVEARGDAILRYFASGLCAWLALRIMVAVRLGGPGFESPKAMLPISAGMQGVAGTTFFGLFLERRLAWSALRGAKWAWLLALVAAIVVVVVRKRFGHG